MFEITEIISHRSISHFIEFRIAESCQWASKNLNKRLPALIENSRSIVSIEGQATRKVAWDSLGNLPGDENLWLDSDTVSLFESRGIDRRGPRKATA